MQVLVTGANGHIGSQVARDLLERGHDVVALVREGADLSGHAGLAVRYARGDIRDPAAVEKAIHGCGAVIHLAAVYKLGARDPNAIIEPAVQGMENVLRAAKRERVRVVHCSSTYAVGFSELPEPRDETCWNERLDDPYAAAKTLSERRARELADSLSVDVVTINPTGVLGPYDYRRTPSHDILIGMAQAPTRYDGGTCFTDIRDASFVLCEALTRGSPGERYIVTSENVTVNDFVSHVTSRTGKWAPSSPLPRSIVVPFWRAMSTLLGWFGAKMPLDPAVINEFYGRWAWFDNRKARATFGWTPQPLNATVDLALHWCVERGWLTGSVGKKITASLGAATSTDRQLP